MVHCHVYFRARLRLAPEEIMRSSQTRPVLLAQYISAVIFSLAVAGNVFCQSASSPDRGVVSTVPYDSSDVENINLQNGNVNLAIPLASLPPIAGGKLSFTLKAYYNSKLYDTYTEERRITPPENNEGLQATRFFVEVPRLSDMGGWRIGGKYELNSVSPADLYVPDQHLTPTPSLQLIQSFPWSKTYLVSPDGAKHEMRPLGYQPYWGSDPLFSGFYKDSPNTTNIAMRYYSVDGTYISMTLYPASHSLLFEANLPDGTKIQQTRTGIQRLIDTNGNKIKIFDDAQGTHYQDELTTREIRVAVNSTTGRTEVWYKTVNAFEQKIEIVFGTTQVRGKFYTVDVPSIWGSQVPASCTYQEPWSEDLTVIREIIFPQTESGVAAPRYSFAYTSDEALADPAMYVAGCNQFPPFSTWPFPSSKGLGELNRMTTPTGAVYKYAYAMDGTNTTSDGSGNISVATNTITQKKIEHDGQANPDIWTYSINIQTGGSVTNADGSTVVLDSYDHFYGNPSTSGGTLGLGGLVYRETRSNKIRTERRWVRRVFNGAYDIAGGGGLLVFNPVVTEEYTSLLDDNGNVLKMAATTFERDFNGNITKRTDYDWFPNLSGVNRDSLGIPLGVPANATVLSMTINSYHNSPGADANSTDVYAKTSNSILNALKEAVTGNSTTRVSYDNQNYGLPPIQGNVTKNAQWDSATSLWVDSLTGYDSFGNVTSKTDPNGNVVTFIYGDNTHALPTATTVNPNNGTGAQSSSTTYDFETGLPTSSTDVNGHISSIDYYNSLLGAVDPFGRVGTITGPYVMVSGVNKRQTVRTYYEDAARRTRVEADLFNEGDQLLKTRTSRDQLGRLVLSEKNENGSSTYTISSQTVFKTQERVVLVSNPATGTPSSSDGWTRSTNDVLGRPTEVATFSGAAQPPVIETNSNWTGSVTSLYVGNTTTVTDQAGRQRRSVFDPRGRLIRQDEPNSAGQFGDIPIQPTSYSYDALGNLTEVQQVGTNSEQCGGGATSCSQTRTFTYSSLSRLLTASNPESGIVTYEYFPNGNLKKRTDARNVQSSYQYDGLNRQTNITYSDTTPSVTYTYDTLPNGKGRLTSLSSSVSTYRYTGYDALGRVTAAEQLQGSRSYGLIYDYYLSGNIKSITYPSGHVANYDYDTSGHLNNFSGNLGGGGASRTYSTGIIYDAADRLKKEQFGTDAAVYNKLWYNARGQLSEIRESTGYTGDNDVTWNRGKIINDYTLQCTGVDCRGSDNNGNLRKQTIGVPNNDQNSTSTSWYQQFEYDTLNRITQVNEFNDQAALLWKQWFKYDRFGNQRIDVSNTSNSVPHPDFEVELGTNRMLAPGDLALAANQRKMRYDSSGNLTNDSWTSFGSSTPGAITRSYDAENRMTSALDDAGGTTQYSYDGNSRRVRRAITNKPEVWQVYGNKGELLAEYPANGDPLAPQKEYGYRNNQLLITAEAATSSAPAPTALVSAPYNNGPSITLNWTAAGGATNYRIEKATSKDGPYTLAGTSASTSFIDNGVTSGTAYLYKVCAANGQNVCTSAYTNFVLGLAITFVTDPVIKSFAEDSVNPTTPKTGHITELRAAVNAVRSLALLPPATWTNSSLQTGVSIISVDDVRDLRARLNDALLVLSIPSPTYEDPTLKGFNEDSQNATPIKAVHIRQLRDFVRSGVGGSGGSSGSSLQLRWLVSDQLGTPRIIFDQTGLLTGTARRDYLPFGEELLTAGLRSAGLGYGNSNLTRQQFTSKERDSETKLDCFIARYYSPAQGRFTSPDEFKGGPDELYVLGSGAEEKQALVYADVRNAQSLNKYQYCFNNPLRYVDPDGHDGVTADSPLVQRMVQGAAIGVGPTLTADGIHRGRYEQAARAAGSKSVRSQLKADTRDNMSIFSRELSEAQDASRVGQELRHTAASARRTSPVWNRVGKGARILGPAATGVAVVFSVYNVASAPSGHRVEAAFVEGTTWAGAAAGASVGAKLGAGVGTFIGGPGLGTAIGAGAGALLGGAGGAFGGSKLGEAIINMPPGQSRMSNEQMIMAQRGTTRAY